TDLTEARAEFRRRQSAGLGAMTAARVSGRSKLYRSGRPAYEARRRLQLTQLERERAAARFLCAKPRQHPRPSISAWARRCHELEAPRPDLNDRGKRRLLEEQKARVDTLEEKRRICKRVTQQTMAALEAISEEVHSVRKTAAAAATATPPAEAATPDSQLVRNPTLHLERNRCQLNDFLYEEFDRYGEVLNFQVVNCPNCSQPTESRMKLVRVPYFKEVVVMATHAKPAVTRTAAVKCGGGIEPQGVRLELAVQEPFDLSRDVLVSDSCMICIPRARRQPGRDESLPARRRHRDASIWRISRSHHRSGNRRRRARTQPSLDSRLILGRSGWQFLRAESVRPDPDRSCCAEKYDRSEEQNESSTDRHEDRELRRAE
uniref:Zpr1 domain-containing protein n=1 Tax=Macrostomum lignano TaxID=282301 RepID=A0A1I8F5P2_9PLAT